MKIAGFKKVLSEVFSNSRAFSEAEDAQQDTFNVKALAAGIMSAASLVLSVMNLVRGYYFMLGTTLILTVGFLIGAILCGVYRKWLPAAIIITLMVGLIFSVYAFTGQNFGFAILWILLIPPIVMNMLGIKTGTYLGVYFQILLFALFYFPPLRNLMMEYQIEEYGEFQYSETFCIRFPVLYMVGLLASLLLAVQKEYYFLKAQNLAHTDALTDLKNRLHYEQIKESYTTVPDDFVFISCDINGLKRTNDTLGHAAGDELIYEAAQCFKENFPDAKVISRIGGDEFVILTEVGKETAEAQIKTLSKNASERNGAIITGISIAVGYAAAADHPGSTVEQLEQIADTAMYSEKKKHYENLLNDRRAR